MTAPNKITLADTPARLARMWSIWLSVALAFLSALQADVLPLVQPLFPPDRWPWVSGGLALAILVARIVKQQSLAAQPGATPAAADAAGPADPQGGPQ